ncbi:MAG TPA: methyltransferase domain-containing protein [Longimicrobium sp.]|nr:methyltransferase domain-containing protein [Longimicrobium sp.]
MAEENEYLLGTGDDELARLGFQHQVWSGEAARGWERAGFAPGHAILDVGCGPGYAAFDLARIVGARGRVHGVDVSERFVAHLRAEARARGAAHLTAEVGDVAAMELAPEFDGAWARWVLCFVPDPAAVVRSVARALRPGGRFVVQDYLKYEGVVMAPEDPAFDRVWAAMVASWRASGGDAHVGAAVPSLMEAAGLEVVDVRPIVRGARPGTALWQWPRTFFTNFLPTLVAGGFVTAADAAAFDARWAERERDPGAFFSTPPMVEVVGVRR